MKRRQPSPATPKETPVITIATNPALHHALTTADTVPCTGDPLWTSDHTEDLETAAQLCIARQCPVLTTCRVAGRNEWGAWGGVVNTVQLNKWKTR